jgi:phage recombination protein Bet
MNETTPMITGNHPATVGMDRSSIDLLKTTICKGSTDDELKLFVQVCQRTGLDPFARQIFAVKRYNRKLQREEMQIQTSIDGFRLIAERSKSYAGQRGPFWTSDGEKWVDVWVLKTPPIAAKIGILRRSFQEPLWAVATWDEFCPLYEGKPMGLWKTMGALMLAKCAESQGLRRAFPQDLSGIYTEEEMAQTVNETEIIEWADEDKSSAKACISDLIEKLIQSGKTKEEAELRVKKQSDAIGDSEISYERWVNRFGSLSERIAIEITPKPVDSQTTEVQP